MKVANWHRAYSNESEDAFNRRMGCLTIARHSPRSSDNFSITRRRVSAADHNCFSRRKRIDLLGYNQDPFPQQCFFRMPSCGCEFLLTRPASAIRVISGNKMALETSGNIACANSPGSLSFLYRVELLSNSFLPRKPADASNGGSSKKAAAFGRHLSVSPHCAALTSARPCSDAKLVGHLHLHLHEQEEETDRPK